MIIGNESRRWLLLVISLLLTIQLRVNSVNGLCEYSFIDRNKLYNFSLASPLPRFPHGVLSEDGFYKVMVNETALWFQDCGGPSHCGMKCSALVAENAGGYQVCTTIGQVSSTNVSVIDKQNPYKGVIVRMSNSGKEHNCSLSVSIICDSTIVQGPNSIKRLGTCDYATVLQHPSGCATIISVHDSGFGWFGTLMIIIVCLFGAYLLAGTVYRYFFLGVHGIEAIPNLDFWASLPHRTQSLFSSLVRKFRGPSASHRSFYSQVNF
ncbi:uncharacterized protein LOC111310095 isoform X2 [Durio zibethinus]|uniref:Uncharacterized protein LOC111310095 isoform X2 n=1 Tax=Durio zibethinus TaxID=66656 RepID=A0A6P6AJC4_DURZI|nr:uncharacterized protein LOC111310095 isoform X2 [Durio zibethinus]